MPKIFPRPPKDTNDLKGKLTKETALPKEYATTKQGTPNVGFGGDGRINTRIKIAERAESKNETREIYKERGERLDKKERDEVRKIRKTKVKVNECH
jgi:hypothetical protein